MKRTRIDEVIDELASFAVRRNDMKLLDDIALMRAGEQFPDVENLSGFQLAEVLGLEIHDTSQESFIKLANACLHITDNPRFQALPLREKVQAMSTAQAFLSYV